MLKDYIKRMLEDNKEELEKQEIVMEQLLVELEYSQKQLVQLRKEINTDKNLFSPRNYDFEADVKIEKAREKVEKTKNEIEYTRERIETFLKKKKEFEILLEETENTKNQLEQGAEVQEEVLEDKYLDLLKEIYKKVEISLALVNSDKNKCKNELKGVLKLLKGTAVKIENEKEL